MKWGTPHQHDETGNDVRDLTLMRAVVQGHVLNVWLTADEYAKLPKIEPRKADQ